MKPRSLMLTAALFAGVAMAGAPAAPGTATTSKAKRTVGTGLLNLNGATLDQIDALPGISPRVAAEVVAERTSHPFTRPEDVLRVKGMSRRRFERLRPHLAVGGPTTFRAARTPRPFPGKASTPTP
jgi:competence protein ComEA